MHRTRFVQNLVLSECSIYNAHQHIRLVGKCKQQMNGKQNIHEHDNSVINNVTGHVYVVRVLFIHQAVCLHSCFVHCFGKYLQWWLLCNCGTLVLWQMFSIRAAYSVAIFRKRVGKRARIKLWPIHVRSKRFEILINCLSKAQTRIQANPMLGRRKS